MDLSWSGGTGFKETLELAAWMQKYSCSEVQMTSQSLISLRRPYLTHLVAPKNAGIRNILALRGATPWGQEKWTHTVEEFRKCQGFNEIY
jgi:hypothetical protein